MYIMHSNIKGINDSILLFYSTYKILNVTGNKTSNNVTKYHVISTVYG